jgi:hypothetical protein
MRRTIRHVIGLAAWALPLSGEVRITVTLYDLAGLSLNVREGMKKETSRIFMQAGVALDWVECETAGRFLNLDQCAEPLGPARLMLQLVPGGNKSNPNASGMASIQGHRTVFACLYPERVSQLAREATWDFRELLGHAAAHELGHLLLRSSTHTPAGVMRARWETEELRKLSHAGLIFLPGQLSAIPALSLPSDPVPRPVRRDER